MDAVLSPEGPKGISISFKPDPLQKTRGNITVGNANNNVSPRINFPLARGKK
jgi:hypothetical protein